MIGQSIAEAADNDFDLAKFAANSGRKFKLVPGFSYLEYMKQCNILFLRLRGNLIYISCHEAWTLSKLSEVALRQKVMIRQKRCMPRRDCGLR